MGDDEVPVNNELPEVVKEVSLDIPSSSQLQLTKYDDGEFTMSLDHHTFIDGMDKDDIISLAKQLLEVVLGDDL